MDQVALRSYGSSVFGAVHNLALSHLIYLDLMSTNGSILSLLTLYTQTSVVAK